MTSSTPSPDEGPYIRLLDGTRWYFDGRRELTCDLSVLVNALGRTSRFTGHMAHPYSVLRHSINAFQTAQAATDDRLVLRQVLCHDLHEALVGDWSTPLKRAMRKGKHNRSAYDHIEDTARRAIAERFGFQFVPYLLTKEVDSLCLGAEIQHVQPGITDSELLEFNLVEPCIEARARHATWSRNGWFKLGTIEDFWTAYRTTV